MLFIGRNVMSDPNKVVQSARFVQQEVRAVGALKAAAAAAARQQPQQQQYCYVCYIGGYGSNCGRGGIAAALVQQAMRPQQLHSGHCIRGAMLRIRL